jgi:hypothetical protein
VLDHCRQGEKNFGSSFFGVFLSARFPKATEDVTVRYLFAVAIIVNYSSEFREVFESAT